MQSLDIVILAAGMGKRMHSALPKVLHPLAGRPLLQHVIDTAQQLHPRSIVIVYGHGGEHVPAAVRGQDLIFVLQEPQLGTGHALAQALPHLSEDGRTLVLYGDVPLTKPASLLEMLKSERTLTLLTLELEDPTGYGRIVRNEEGKVNRIVEHKDASAKQAEIREINTGILVAETALLRRFLPQLKNQNAQREYYLTDVVALAIESGYTVETGQPSESWEALGVNSKSELAKLERICQLECAKRLLAAGVTLADPARVEVRGELECGRDVVIDIDCIFEGCVTLGDGTEVGAHCILKDVAVGVGSKILPYTLIESAEIGPDCRVGPYARVRPGTVLAAEAHIGNFVEVKNSQIGANSKANHLSYVGDCEVGKNVNIGAGTITCNYDGANKHRTVIEDDAFIGSDTQLVAPVKVGRGATIGAGATITKDAPPDRLTLSRAPQISVASWKRPVKKTVKE
jgi:bifunctional UDP-N-acetylglucosamine pyrophosphorylase / glucosamine-1-phosphate N-acetyltransferase